MMIDSSSISAKISLKSHSPRQKNLAAYMILSMNKIILLLSFVLSTSAWANILNWDELEPNTKYTVAYDIPFDENLTLKADSPLYFQEAMDLGGVPVMLFIFQNPNCVDPDFYSEMALFNPEPEDTQNDKSIGIGFSKECTVDIYIEPKFYYNRSIFKN